MRNTFQKIWYSRKHFLITFFVVSLLIKLTYVFTLEDKWYFFDTSHYERAAVSLITNGDFGDGYLHDHVGGMAYSLEPVYPIFMAGIYKVFGHNLIAVRIVQSLLMSFLLILIFLIAEKTFHNFNISKSAFLIGMVYPYFIFIGGLLYVTAVFTFLLALTIYFIASNYESPLWVKSILIGLFLGLSTLCRPLVIFFIPLWIIWTLIFVKRRMMQKIGDILIAGVMFFLVLTPWQIRNYKIFERFTPVRAYKGEINRLDKRYQDYEFKYGNYEGDELSIGVKSDSLTNRFEFYYNDIYKGELVDSAKTFALQTYYGGVYLRGGRNNAVAEFEASTDGSAPVKDDFLLNAEQWVISKNIGVLNGQLTNISETESWGDFATFTGVKNPHTVSIKWGKNVDAMAASESGMFFLDGDPTDSDSGYFLIRKPTGKISLWHVRDGYPIKGIDYKIELNSKFNTPSVATMVFNLVRTMPIVFLGDYFSELTNFWNPYIAFETRYSQNSFSGDVFKHIGALAFGLLLVFGVIGLYKMPNSTTKQQLILIFLMIMAFALAYSFFGVRTRYRIPTDPYLLIIAAAGFTQIFTKALSRLRS